jgi:hypothetical protein
MKQYVYKTLAELEGLQAAAERAAACRSAPSGMEVFLRLLSRCAVVPLTGESPAETLARVAEISTPELKDFLWERAQQPDHFQDALLLPAGPRLPAVIGSLSSFESEAILYDWNFWARNAQGEPAGAWSSWLILAGRGFGKTRLGAETVRRWSKDFALVNLIGATADDARDIMIEGESGILAVCPPQERPRYLPSKRAFLTRSDQLRPRYC